MAQAPRNTGEARPTRGGLPGKPVLHGVDCRGSPSCNFVCCENLVGQASPIPIGEPVFGISTGGV
jgi:hypothetical protein